VKYHYGFSADFTDFYVFLVGFYKNWFIDIYNSTKKRIAGRYVDSLMGYAPNCNWGAFPVFKKLINSLGTYPPTSG
jgi:hypothetical protein